MIENEPLTVTSCAGIVFGISDHPLKVYPSLVGSASGVIAVPNSRVMVLYTSPSTIYSNEYELTENEPLTVTSCAGIVSGISDQPLKVYPSLVGSASGVIVAPYSTVIVLYSAPSTTYFSEYVLIENEPLTVTSCAGIVSGISDHPLKVYPSLVGSASGVILVPNSRVSVLNVLPSTTYFNE